MQEEYIEAARPKILWARSVMILAMLGLASMLIQAVFFAWPTRFSARGVRTGSAARFGSAPPSLCSPAFTLVQFVIVSPLIALAYREANPAAASLPESEKAHAS